MPVWWNAFTAFLAALVNQYQQNQIAEWTFDTFKKVDLILRAINNTVFGLSAIKDNTDNIRTDVGTIESNILDALATTEANILAAIGTPVQTGTPPIWYTDPTAAPPGTYANDVWAYLIGGTERADNVMYYLERLGANIGLYAALPVQGNPLFAVELSWKYPPD